METLDRTMYPQDLGTTSFVKLPYSWSAIENKSSINPNTAADLKSRGIELLVLILRQLDQQTSVFCFLRPRKLGRLRDFVESMDYHTVESET